MWDKLEDSIDSVNFPLRGCLHSIRRISLTPLPSSIIYIWMDFLFHAILENLMILIYIFDRPYLIQCPVVSTLLLTTILFFVFSFWYRFMGHTEGVSVKLCANVLFFGNFNVYRKDLLTYFMIIFLFLTTLLKLLTFPVGSLNMMLIILLFWIHF